MRRRFPRWCCFAILPWFLLSLPATVVSRDDGWIHTRDPEAKILIMTKRLAIHPMAEPKPALKYRLLVDPAEALPGNSAIHFLMASGYFEQTSAHKLNAKFQEDAVKKARDESVELDEVAPWSWLETPPDELPLDEVKEYLAPLSFQERFLREIARRNHFDMDRDSRNVDDPIGFLLPEIQGSRELARTQILRCRVALAEDRIDDAIEITGQRFAMATQLGQDDFLVSNLVGIAIAITAWNDMLYLVQHEEAPNLYWALSTMPTPLVNIQHSMSIERQLLYRQLKVLKEVDETPKSAGYWEDFVNRMVSQIGSVGPDIGLPGNDKGREAVHAALTRHIDLAYPGATKYLLNEEKLPREQVEGYEKEQVVFLAMVRFYDEWRDEYFKWMHLPFWQASEKMSFNDLGKSLKAEADKYGWCAKPTSVLLPAVRAARIAEARCDQSIALIQTVECLRMYAAANNNTLPKSLDDLAVPAPIDPFTGQPVDYQLDGKQATITGHPLPGMQYRLIVRMAGGSFR